MTRLSYAPCSVFLVAAFVSLFGQTPVHAQERDNTLPRVSPNATVSQTVGVTEVRITYGRPSVRDRDIFGGLVPYDEVWRTGANEATTVSFSTPVEIEGQSLDAGTYGLFTIPGTATWTIIFNNNSNQWGAYSYDSDQDVLRVEVEPEQAAFRELMTFSFRNVSDTSGTCVLRWAETSVPFDISVDTDEIIRTRAESAVSETEDWQVPLRYASYALENEVFLTDALQWVDRSLELEERFANLRLKAHLLGATDQTAEAIEAADAALSKAESMEEPPRGVDDLRNELEGWQSSE